MKIVVTGATGLLGKATAEHLVRQSHEVISVDRREGECAKGSTPQNFMKSKFLKFAKTDIN